MMGLLSYPSPDFWKAKRILITGHTGFKGAWCSLWLTRLGAKVTGLALPPHTRPSLFSLTALDRMMVSIFGDIRDLEKVITTVEDSKPEIIIHMAAQALVRSSYHDPLGTYQTNVMGTAHLLEAARRCPSSRAIIVVTSDKCYENQEWCWPYRETEPMGGHDPYSSSKGCAELLVSAWRKSFFNQAGSAGVATVRAGNVIGGGDWADDRLIPDCVRSLADGQTIGIRRPQAIRPWQHVLEPLSGYLKLAELLFTDVGFSEAWNFGPPDSGAKPVSWVVAQIVELWGDKAAWNIVGHDNLHEVTTLKLDASKAGLRLGWHPRLKLTTAIDWTVDWYRRFYQGEDAVKLTMNQIQQYEETDGLNG